MSRDGAARPVSTKLKMTRGNLGVTGEIKLAEMAALPPFAQVIADMDGLGCGRLAPWQTVCSWWKTYHANFTHSITSEVIELAIGPGHLHRHRR